MSNYVAPFKILYLLTILGMSCGSMVVAQEQAEETDLEQQEKTVDRVNEKIIVVTARKFEEPIEKAPLSISAYFSDDIESHKIRDFTSLAVAIPNVALDEIGSTRGTANFSIRGLGVNSSIPSIDPTVGIFVDGVYIGLNSGIVFDLFDLDSIEILRGPQSTLFGRNVTGGAILVNNKIPGDKFEVTLRSAFEGGGEAPNYYAMASVEGALNDNINGRFSVYTNQDKGWFKNLANGQSFGQADTIVIKPSLSWQLSDSVRLILRYEHMETDDDGPAGQSHTNGSGIANAWSNFARDSHDFAISEPGYQRTETDFLTSSIKWEMGNGEFTNITGWRKQSSDALLDVDASVASVFDAIFITRSEQWSNELRYSQTFGEQTQLTSGLYYFNNQIDYHERRLLLSEVTADGTPALTQDGGGNYKVDNLGLYIALDYPLSESLVFNTGVSYSHEEKQVDIASLPLNVNSPCSVVAGSCPIDFSDKKSWESFAPKLGMSYALSEQTQLYTHWTRGFRSGGYNLRNTASDVVNLGPGPFDEEQADNYELGVKVKWGPGAYLYGAIFHNKIKDMQREINLSDPASGVVQLIRNTADAEITGIELETGLKLTDSLHLDISLGYIDPEYKRVNFDLDGDGLINQADKNLKLPRAAELTYSAGLYHDIQLGEWGQMRSRLNYAYRDESAYTDNNLGFIGAQRIVDAGLDFYSNDGHWTFSLYGKNLLDEVKHGGDTQLPATLGGFPLGGTFSPLSKGHVIGIEVTYVSR